MNIFNIESESDLTKVSLRFQAGEGRLILLGESSGLSNVNIPAFHPGRDLYYPSPVPPVPQELAEELRIHVPDSLHRVSKGRFAISAVGGLVLMQYVHPASPAISPLAALAEVLRADADVNFGILQADNGGILFIRRAGPNLEAYASSHSLKSFLELERDERETHFPGFHAAEVLVSGTDLDHFEQLDLGPMEIARRISMEDLSSVCECIPEARASIAPSPHFYTLAIGAARAYAMIGGWL